MMTLTLVYQIERVGGSIMGSVNVVWNRHDGSILRLGGDCQPMVTMSQFLAMSFLFIGVVFIMLPNWTSEEQLKKATVTLILLQIIAVALQVFHLTSGAIPSGGMQYFGIALSLLFIILFYWKSR